MEELGLLEEFAKLVGKKHGSLRVNINGELTEVKSSVEGAKLSFAEKLLLAEQTLRGEIDLVAAALPDGGNTAINFDADAGLRIIGELFNEDEWTRIVGMAMDGKLSTLISSDTHSATTRRYLQEFGQGNWRKVQLSTVESMVDLGAYEITVNSFKTLIPHERGDIVIIDDADTFVDSSTVDADGIYTCVFATLDLAPTTIVGVAKSTMQLSDDSGKEAGTIEVEIDGVVTTMPTDVFTDPLNIENIQIVGNAKVLDIIGTDGTASMLNVFGDNGINHTKNSVGFNRIDTTRQELKVSLAREAFVDSIKIAVAWSASYKDGYSYSIEDTDTGEVLVPQSEVTAKFTSWDSFATYGGIELDINAIAKNFTIVLHPTSGYPVNYAVCIAHMDLYSEGTNIYIPEIKKTYEAQVVDTESLRFKYETTSVNDLVELNADLYTEIQ